MASVMRIVITSILFGTLFIAALNILSNANDFTQTGGESINSSTYGTPVYLKSQGVVPNSERVYNSSKTFINTNYTMDNAAGTITFKAGAWPGYNVTNNTVYSIDYQSGKQPSAVKTMWNTVLLLLIAVLGIVVLAENFGIDILGRLK